MQSTDKTEADRRPARLSASWEQGIGPAEHQTRVAIGRHAAAQLGQDDGMDGRAVVVGEALIDVVQQGSVTEEHAGGSALNVAVALGRLDRPVDFLTRMGEDDRGAVLREHLRACGVDLLPESVVPSSPTSTAVATLDTQGVASYQFNLDWDVAIEAAPMTPLVVHASSMGTVTPPGGAKVADYMQRTRDRATISYDPNTRAGIMGPVDRVRPLVERLVGLSDVVKASTEDIAWLYPGSSAEEVVRRWSQAGPYLVVITDGENGALAATRQTLLQVPAEPATVVDTIGAGDTFSAGLIDGLWAQNLLSAHRRAQLAALSRDDAARLLVHAGRAAAITVSRAGARPPTRQEMIEAYGG